VDRRQALGERRTARSDRRRANVAAERALEVMESMGDAFVTLDSDWRITYLNPQTNAILRRDRDTLLGKSLWEAFPEAVGSGFEEAFRRAVRDQTPVCFEETYGPLGRTFDVRAYPMPEGLAVYFGDVTNDRRREAQQQQAHRLEALGELTAGVAHDFHNLLAAVGGFAQLGQAQSAPGEPVRAYFDQIKLASERAGALTLQLLAFGRPELVDSEPVDLNELVTDLSPLLSQLTPSGIELRLALAPQPVVVCANRSQLEQVLVNLVVNSRDAVTPPGTITITTTATQPAAVLDDVPLPSGWLQVSDTGSGIPAEVVPRIFDPYFSTKTPETGTGLGLATTYGIVSRSRGSIFVDSAVDVGTTMSIALPRPVHPPPIA
jgi:signal transduction histidine kinase